MRRLLVAVIAFLFLGMTFTGCIAPSNVEGFAPSDLVAPTLPIIEHGTSQAPTPSTSVRQNAEWGIEWSVTDVYAINGGVIWLWLDNVGSHDIYVYGASLRWNNSYPHNSREAAQLCTAGQKTEVGLLAFDAPTNPGVYHYDIYLNMAVATLAGDSWYDYGELRAGGHTETVLNLTQASPWTTERNTRSYYNDVNSLVNFNVTSSIVSNIRAQYPGDYSILQVAAAYEWVIRNIEYLADEGDYWQSANETLTLRTGDCEDHAILMASIISELGGKARVNFIEEHAFPTVFVSINESALEDLQRSLDSFYWTGGNLRVNYLTDNLGYWLVVDTAGIPYAGGLPALSKYAWVSDTSLSWSFEASDYLITVDVTGQPANGGFFDLF